MIGTAIRCKYTNFISSIAHPDVYIFRSAVMRLWSEVYCYPEFLLRKKIEKNCKKIW